MASGKASIFVDFDGTLCFDYFWRSAQISDRERIQKLMFQQSMGLVEEWMRGKRTAEEVNLHAATELGLDYESLWSLFQNDCRTMRVADHTLDHIREIGARFQTVLVTDNMDSFDRFTSPALKLENYFHEIVNSAGFGLLKGDAGGGLFLKAAQQFEADISSSHLIDNSEANCRIFTALGGTSHLVSKPEDIDIVLGRLSTAAVAA